ncbi:hypothetical protein [Pedobacter sp. R20-19]|uniref:hypothetical protein n=1 Tax=Pedobacter sp. R20-19 TaxID=1270196 RepID=UPI000493491D|nr:hypothetical protein [Pedobacter sp. R20-19]
MNDNYSHIICIHPDDTSTSFLSVIGAEIDKHYSTIPANQASHAALIDTIAGYQGTALIIFLGHGSHGSLFGSCDSPSGGKAIFLTLDSTRKLFNGHDVLLVSCNSADFLNKQNSFKNAIGFGNIISSKDEANSEAEFITGVYRDIDTPDIDIFNECFAASVAQAIKLLVNGTILFPELYTYLLYFLNQKINKILLDKSIEKRISIAELLFETRAEMKLF